MANYKVYFSGNYMIVVNTTTSKVYEAPKKDSKVIKESTDVYSLIVGSRQFKDIPFTNIKDANGDAYSDAATFETLYRSNSGDSMDISIDDTRTFENAITVPDVTVSNQTASRVASIDGSKKVISLNTATYPSLAELAYVKGVTSAIQTQIDSKVTAVKTIVAKTDDYTFALTEAGKVVTFSKGSAVTGTIPLNAAVAFPIGTEIEVVNLGVGTLTIAITATGTLLSKSSLVAVTTGGTVKLLKLATNTWALTGDLS